MDASDSNRGEGVVILIKFWPNVNGILEKNKVSQMFSNISNVKIYKLLYASRFYIQYPIFYNYVIYFGNSIVNHRITKELYRMFKVIVFDS